MSRAISTLTFSCNKETQTREAFLENLKGEVLQPLLGLKVIIIGNMESPSFDNVFRKPKKEPGRGLKKT
jgi:hypothetical protein